MLGTLLRHLGSHFDPRYAGVTCLFAGLDVDRVQIVIAVPVAGEQVRRDTLRRVGVVVIFIGGATGVAAYTHELGEEAAGNGTE